MRLARPVALAAALVLIGFSAIPVRAQTPGVVGDWELTWETPRGERTMTVTFTAADDGALAGTAQTRMGAAPVKDVALEGDRLSFTIEFGRDDRTFSLPFEGTISGDTMTGTITGMRGDPSPFTGKRKSG